ncbi:MAG: 30S ribosomal protein S7 [Candidatus Marinimicrobia bacterium]|jgi:small subunit ribosomal protein S7|nr:30S ribosomal protein S7 [Candidatus Neomarinimicrobiota bacterium]
MRRRRPEKRTILPDPVYGDLAVAKFINYLMSRGKKGVAEKIFYDAMDTIKQRTKTDGKKVFEDALENTSPVLEVKSRRIGGATYQVPIEVAEGRRFFLASHWIINSATSRSGKPMAECLAHELISAANNEGGAIKKKDDTHRMAEANKAFAHYGRRR